MSSDTPEQRWNSYLAAYGPVTAGERERLLKQSVADDVVFTNPGGEGQTRAGLIAHIEDFQRKMPGGLRQDGKGVCPPRRGSRSLVHVQEGRCQSRDGL